MVFHGQDMEFTAQRNGIRAGKLVKPWLKEIETWLANP
jgi:hypothetical protein